MSLLKSSNFNFTQDFFEKQIFPPYYKRIRNKLNNEVYLNPYFNEIEQGYKKEVKLIEFIPPFIHLDLETKQLPLTSFKYKYFKGYMCKIDLYDNLKDYMNDQLGKKRTKQISSRLKRLETCFDISYKVILGEINEEECLLLMDELRLMIEKRFDQRGDVHGSLKNWNFYKESTYKMIKDKKACLFVTYSGNKPITISLNYIYQNIFESAISSYDIDYGKYGLGNIVVLKKLEWCFNNDFTIFNMRYGDYTYKKDWCNTVFDYESHVIYDRKSLYLTFKAFLIKNKNKFRYFLIKNKDTLIVRKAKSFIIKKTEISNPSDNFLKIYNYKVISDPIGLKEVKHSLIDINDSEFLKKYIYDFQYLNSAKYSTVNVYKLDVIDCDTYCVKSKENIIYFSLS